MNFKKTDITLISPVRNSSKYLSAEATHLRKILLETFEKVHLVFIESDSSDNTVEIGQALSSEKILDTFISLGELGVKYPYRTDRIAYARNTGLDIAIHKYNTEYIAFADTDGINGSLTSEGVASCFRYSGWSGMIANQYGRYYDIYALRHPIWCPGDCWVQYTELARQLSPELARWVCVGSRQTKISNKTQPIQVLSGSGGFGVFKTDSIRKSSFKGLDKNGKEICEWISFCESVDGGIFINPVMQNTGPAEHYVPIPDGIY